ncbi:MAG TPA: hypothetical protein VI756_21215 [Blastocatellia bacterium]
MEQENEIAKLVNVLRRTARMAMQSAWTEAGQDSGAFCAEQYNRVLARLKELDPSLTPVFEPLPANSSLTVAAMACRQLAAYYEDEASSRGWSGAYGVGFDPRAFKDFWCKSAKDIEDLGEFIRESVEEWSRQRRGRREEGHREERRREERREPGSC